MSGDSAELEALFDSIATGQTATPPPAAPAPAPVQAAPAARSEVGDSDELQALFDSVAAENVAPVVAAAESAEHADGEFDNQGRVFLRVGQMARQLHDTLRELGYDKMIAQTVDALPDAKDRLAYIANLTEQAACKVLNATDVANPLLDSVESEAQALAARWDKVYANQMGVDDFKRLSDETREFLRSGMLQKTGGVKTQIMEIIMAQDFQDLTGQVIKKVVTLAQDLEAQLMNALIDVIPGEKRTDSVNSLLNGPVISAEGRSDVVVDQQQVDDLLDSLGF